jgi:hypothetical protein
VISAVALALPAITIVVVDIRRCSRSVVIVVDVLIVVAVVRVAILTGLVRIAWRTRMDVVAVATAKPRSLLELRCRS